MTGTMSRLSAFTTLAALLLFSQDHYDVVPRAVCLADLPISKHPEQAARVAVQHKDYRLFRYEQNGFVARDEVAGLESCEGVALNVREQMPPPTTQSRELLDRNTIWLIKLHDPANEAPCDDCGFPITACGELRLNYAGIYNRGIMRSLVRGAAPRCWRNQ